MEAQFNHPQSIARIDEYEEICIFCQISKKNVDIKMDAPSLLGANIIGRRFRNKIFRDELKRRFVRH